MDVHTFQFSRSLRTRKHSTQSRSSAPTEQFSTRRSLSASGGQFFFLFRFFYFYSASGGQFFIIIQTFFYLFRFLIFNQLVVVIDKQSKPTYCIKYNRPSKYATSQFSNTPILQRWWWCVVKPMKFSTLSPINHSTVWMVVITQMKKIIKNIKR